MEPIVTPNCGTTTCAHCGKAISFDKGEVFSDGASYLCKEHQFSGAVYTEYAELYGNLFTVMEG